MVHGFLFSFLLLFLSVGLLIVVIKIMRTISPQLQMTNIVVLFMVFYVVFAYVGSVILNVWYTEPGERYLVYTRPDILVKIWIVTSFSMLTIPLFTSIILCSVGFSSLTMYPIKKTHMSYIERIITYAIFFVCCIFFLAYIKKIGGVPLLRYIQDTSLSQAFLRSEATNNFSGKAWRYVLFYKSIPLTLLILVSFSDSKKFRNLLFIYVAFVCVMNFEKAPIIKLLIIMVLIYFRKKGAIRFKSLVFLSFFSLCCLIPMYIFFMNSSGNLDEIIKSLFGRAFLTQIIPFFWYFRYVEMVDFLNGTSFPNPSGIFPFEHTRITVDIMNLYRNQAGIEIDAVGSMPTVFMADWYVNFGYIGVAISILIFTLMLVCIIVIFNKFLHKYNDIYTNAALIIIIEHFAWYSGSSFIGIILDTNLIIPLCLLFALKCLRNSQCLFRLHVPKEIASE